MGIITNAGTDYDTSTAVYTITMPLGQSCDGLEMRAKIIGSAVKIVKSVNKHNNGKVFKITRSFVQVEEADAAASSTNVDKDSAKLGAKKGHSLVEAVSTLVISEPTSSCAVRAATDYAFPVLRPVTPTRPSAGTDLVDVTYTDLEANVANYDNCAVSLRRYVITLDSMP